MQAQTDVVKSVIATLEAFPSDARAVFAEGLPGSLTGTGRLLFNAALEDAQGAAAKASAEAIAAAEAATGELDTLTQAVAEAEKALESASAEVERTHTESKELSKELKEVEIEHTNLQRMNNRNMEKWDKQREDRGRAESVLDGSFRMLETGGWEDEEVKGDAIEAVESFLTDISAEKVLIAAVPSAIAAKPDTRKDFDKMAVQATGDILTKHLQSLKDQIAQSEPEEKEARAELLGLWAITEVAKQKTSKATDAALIANAELATSQSNLKLSKKRLAEADVGAQKAAEKKARCEARIAELEAGKAAAEALQAAAEAPPAAAVGAPDGEATATASAAS